MVSNFSDFDVDDRILKAISKIGWTVPSEIQKRGIPPTLEGKDVILRAKTGCGKTAAYLIPLIHKVLQNKSAGKKKSVSLILVPSKELAKQAFRSAIDLTAYCSKSFQVLDLGNSTVENVASLISTADLLISTPSKLLAHINNKTLNLSNLNFQVFDEADMMFSYGYENDLKEIINHLPKICQSILVSATLSKEVKGLESLILNNPVLLKLQDTDSPDGEKLTQYVVKCEPSDKYLLTYALFKLNLVRGKTLIFVNSIDKCYRLKLFFEQFYIKTCVINSELPQSSRMHIVDEFNRGVYDIVIATDEAVVLKSEDVKPESSKKKKKGKKSTKEEYNVSRGIDFQDVDNVLNFDFPITSDSYIHRVGRTARGNNTGTALSFASSKDNQARLKRLEEKLKSDVTDTSSTLKPYNFKVDEIEGFRYRVADVVNSITRIKIKDARFKEIKGEILNSEKLKTYFEDNPKELKVLRHDKILKPADQKPHMKNIPDYLVPNALKNVMLKPKRKRKAPVNLHEKKRKKKTDPLKTFKYNKK